MTVIWTLEAEQDRADVFDYIAADNPDAATQMDKLFSKAAASLAIHAELGKIGKVTGTRELIPHRNYRLVYEIQPDAVWVLALVHACRKYPFPAGVLP